mmetsp:Transcript_18492/g.50504  ORF Transcript_18492/g.50504 Transcript_18492/m.50504 type:complete len:238 (-) Transcript_18492:445-1158(-)
MVASVFWRERKKKEFIVLSCCVLPVVQNNRSTPGQASHPSDFILTLFLSRLLFEITHIGSHHRVTVQFQGTQRRNFGPLIVFDKQGQGRHALVQDVLEFDRCRSLFQIFGRQVQRLLRIDIFGVFESQIFAIDKQVDFGGIEFGIDAIVKGDELDGFDLDKFPKRNVQNELFVGVAFATQCGIADKQIGQRCAGGLILGVTLLRVNVGIQIDRLTVAGGVGRSGASSGSRRIGGSGE